MTYHIERMDDEVALGFEISQSLCDMHGHHFQIGLKFLVWLIWIEVW